MPGTRFIVYELNENEESEVKFMGNEEIINSLGDNITYVIVDNKNQVLITLLGNMASPKMKFFASMFTVELHRRKYPKYQTTTFDVIDEFRRYLGKENALRFTGKELKKFEQKIKPRFIKGGT
ncbi:MAG: hypothetical protein J7L47_00030 [Candidatus Odinarchaeota archaeon]|nr:hypothetical protein [Candidatus Odinarchaeota archaeon]